MNASRVRVMNWFANSKSCRFRGSSHAENYVEFLKRFAQIMHISNWYRRFARNLSPFSCLLCVVDIFFYVYFCFFAFSLIVYRRNGFLCSFRRKSIFDNNKLCLHTKGRKIHAHKSRC